MGIAAEPLPRGDLPAEMQQLLFAEASFQKRPGVDARGGVALKEDLIAVAVAVGALEEVV